MAQGTADAGELKRIAARVRKSLVSLLSEAKSGHSAGALGLVEVFVTLYFGEMRVDPENPGWEERDRMVLSNGHVCPVHYAVLAEAGFFPALELRTLRRFGSRLQGHPHRGSLPGIENSSGPLGQGISIAAGMALYAKRAGKCWRVYCVCSDGEQNEGQVWEAVLSGAKFGLDNLVVVIDRNRIQIDGGTEEVMPLEPLAAKYRDFGWNVIEIDGHNVLQLLNAFQFARESKGKPTAIIANTVPGKAVSFMERSVEWHGKVPDEKQTESAFRELDEYSESLGLLGVRD
jgi:transketolase